MNSLSNQRAAPPPSADRQALFARLSHWAILRFLVEAMALIVTFIVIIVLSGRLIPPAPAAAHQSLVLIRNLVGTILPLGVYLLTVGWMERRGAAELGLRAGGPQLLAGAAIGAMMMAAVYLILWGLGLATFGPGDGLTGFGPGLASALRAAVFEELLLRAVLFRITEEACGTTIAVIVSAAVFGLLHGINPGATPMSTLAIALEAGVLLALAYALTRNLWLAIGIHLAWNFTEGSVFGAQVSGSAISRSLIHSTLAGPPWLTGGDFGPEASVVSIGVSMVVATVIAVLIMRQGGWRPRALRLRLG